MDGLKHGGVGPVAELLERVIAEAVAPQVLAAREKGWRDGYSAGRAEEREAWRARLRGLLGDHEQDTEAGVPGAAAPVGPPPEAVGMTAVMAVEEEAEAGAGLPTGALSSPASAPQPIGEPPNTGGEDTAAPLTGSAADRAPASPELPASDDDEERQPEPQSSAAASADAGPAPAAAAGALPEAPSASPAVAPPVWEDWRTPEREVVLREMWPQAGASMKAIFHALAHVAGPKMPADAENARHWGKKLGLGPRPVISPSAPPVPVAEPSPEPEHLRETPQMVRARELLAMGLHPNDIKVAVRLSAVEFGEVCRLHKAQAA